jgi:hypothetical protein
MESWIRIAERKNENKYFNLSDAKKRSCLDQPFLKVEKVEKVEKKIKKLDFFCKNEIEISLLIKTIPLYKYYFQPVLEYKEIRLKEIDDVEFIRQEQITINQEIIQNNRYILLSYDKNSIPFNSFFKNIKNENKRINCIHNSFDNLLKIIEILNENNIVVINFNILFKPDNSCVISNFSHSFVNHSINEERKALLNKYFFSKYEPENIIMPVDYHILCFMNENKIKALSRSNIDKIIGHFSKDNNDKNDNNNYYRFINKSYNDVFIEILKNSNNWNLYQIQPFNNLL